MTPSAVDATNPVTTGTVPKRIRGRSCVDARSRVSSMSGLACPKVSSVMRRPSAESASAAIPRLFRSAATIGAQTRSPYDRTASIERGLHSRRSATLRSSAIVRSVSSPISVSSSAPAMPTRSAARFLCCSARRWMICCAPAASPAVATWAALTSASVVPAVADTMTSRSPDAPPTIFARDSTAGGDATEVPPNLKTSGPLIGPSARSRSRRRVSRKRWRRRRPPVRSR